MGAKSSKSELTRRKSFTTLGRSSQRSLFQKSKLKLNRINKQIDSTEVHANIESDLDEIENELNGISETVKEKNHEKYDEVCRYLQNTRKKFEEKVVKTNANEVIEHEDDVVLRAGADSNGNVSEEHRKPSVTFKEINEVLEEPIKRPSVKFGVQVLPPSPQQVLLKRKTYPNPTNNSPKNEGPQRNTTDGVQIQNGTTFSKYTLRTSNSFNSENDSTKYTVTQTSITRTVSLKTGILLRIESVNKKINELEGKLKYFNGGKGSQNYIELHEGLVNNLALLDSIDTEEDSIAKQEKKILGQRISELLKILECLVNQIDEDSDDQVFSKKVEDHQRVMSSVTAI